MSVELDAALAFATAGVVTLAATPVAIRVAQRADFYDRPREYRQHESATPFLGGAAVLAGFLVAAVAVGGLSGRPVVVACLIGIWLLGTLDDRVSVPPAWRLLAEACAATALFAAGLRWPTGLSPTADFVLTMIWVIGIVNAFNLMDNLDGACSSVGAVAAAGIGVLAATRGQVTLAALAFALSGACAGFLPWNLAGPARIFLGGGGSMSVGFLVAVLAMAATTGGAGLLIAALLVGLPILDVTLVTVSRTRRRVPLTTGGRDHLTHRVLPRLGSPRAVALALALGQAALCSLAILAYELGTGVVVAFAIVAAVAGSVAIIALDTAGWRPAGIAFGAPRAVVAHTRVEPTSAASVGVDSD